MKSDVKQALPHPCDPTDIIYSAIITCLGRVFLVTNLSMVARYMGNKGGGKMLVMVQMPFESEQHGSCPIVSHALGDPAFLLLL